MDANCAQIRKHEGKFYGIDYHHIPCDANQAADHLLWGYGPQDMGRTIGGGLVLKIKACTALLGVHRKTLYSTK